MGVVVVTGAGTDIGKTYVSCAILRVFRDAALPVVALKPVASGVAPVGDPAFEFSDTARLLSAAGVEATKRAIEACSPWRFGAPLSPDMAAAHERRTLRLDDVVAWSRRAVTKARPEALVLIEGVGGVMSPIAEDGLVVDFISALGCPALLVAGAYLGAISHALTAVSALQRQGIEVAGVIVNAHERGIDAAATADAIRRHGPPLPVHSLSFGGNLPAAVIERLLTLS